MRYFSILALFIVLSACSRTQDQRISLPEVSDDFYQKSLKLVQEQYTQSPTDQLLRQKLYYYEKLGWPKEALPDLNIYLEKHGLNRQSVSLFAQYYLQNDQYGQLITLIDKWEYYHGLDEELAQFRISSNIQAKGEEGTTELIEAYLDKFNSTESYVFAIRESFQFKDTTLQNKLLYRLSDLAPQHPLIAQHHIPNLVKEGSYLDAHALLSSHPNQESQELNLLKAQVLYALDSTRKAKILLRGSSDMESIRQLAYWFRNEQQLDSAIVYIDKLLVQDSSRANILLKAVVLDERGWFNTSLDYFNVLLKRDPSDTIAIEKAQIVERKIAYLRNLKEKAVQAPVLELEPKKIIE